MPPTTYIFAGGGTGGHLFPGLAIADALRSLDPTACALFLCSTRPLDSRILTEQHAEFRPIPAQPLSLHPRRLTRFLASWSKSIRESRHIIREARSNGPVHIIAMGGFVAAPVVQAARVERTPITLVNLDAVPGKANRWIAQRVQRGRGNSGGGGAGIFTAAPVSAPFARHWTSTPPIVRPAALAQGSQSDCRKRLNLDPHRPTLMITGGSQGARSINDFLLAFARDNRDLLSRWQILHQCGKDADAALRDAYAQLNIPALVAPFVPTMSDWWGAADLAVSRSGAGSVAEAWANHVPALFLPYPYHRDQHQRLNAAPLIDCAGARLADDRIDPALTLESAGPTLRTLLSDPSLRASMRTNLTRLGPANGAHRIASALMAFRGTQRVPLSARSGTGSASRPAHPNETRARKAQPSPLGGEGGPLL